MDYRRRLGMFAARVALGAALITGSAGCGALNMKALWAAAEPAPMQVVVRRADAARATAMNVERLMSSTGVDDDSKWVVRIGLKKVDVEPLLKEIGGDPEYHGSPKPQKLRIVEAEAWARLLSGLCSTESKSPSLYATLSPDVHAMYADIASQAKNIAKFKSDIAIEEAAMDDKERAGEKAEHEAKKKELQGEIDKAEKEYKPKIEAFMAKIKEDAAKATPEAKKQMAAAIAGLKRAVDDAKMANGAALLGYPRAVAGLKDEVKFMVKRIAADVIEEKVGTRPNTEKLVPEVKLTGGVSVTIAGLDASDVGKLNPADVVKDIAERSKNYVVHVVTLLGYISETADLLSLQWDVLNAAQAAISGDDAAGGGEDISSLKASAEAIGAANAGGPTAGGKGGKRMYIPMNACEEKKAAPPPPAEPAKADAPPPKDPDEDDPKKKGGKKGGKAAPPPPKKKGK